MACSCNINQQAPMQTGSLVYLNKIYYDNRDTSCPLLHELTTSPVTFTQRLQTNAIQTCGCNCGCGCGCNCGCGCDLTLTEDTVFNITNTYITIDEFGLSPTAELEAADITIDGRTITGLSYNNGQYIGDLSGIMDQITTCPCATKRTACTCMPNDNCHMDCDNDGHFFLAQVPGPWILNATLVLEGNVTSLGRTCTFKICLRTVQNCQHPGIIIPGSNNFALYCVDIPCQTAGIAPSLLFDFDACASLLNPQLSVVCIDGEPVIQLNTVLVLTPEIHLQVIKATRFNLNATEVPIPCDNIGQCDPCDTTQSGCGCTCGEQEETRETTTRSCGCQQNETTSRTAACTSCNPYTGFVCQCCDTNGFRF